MKPTRIKSALLRLAALLPAIALAAALACACALAEDIAFTAPEEHIVPGDGGFDSAELAEGYIRQMLPAADGGRAWAAPRNLGGDLTGSEAALYNLLLEQIRLVAAGQRDSTRFSFPVASIYPKITFTKEELGVSAIVENGSFTDEAKAAVAAIIRIDFSLVSAALLRDCPYELYWYDKTAGSSYGGVSYSGNSASISLKENYTVTMPVSQDYDAGDAYTVDTGYGQAVSAAAANAAGVVAQYRQADDLDALHGYLETICAMTDYNYDAVENKDTTPYGNPWQLVWVFDGDPETKVVCEGYAKAFQYLCDLTRFYSDDITVISVSGTMSDGKESGNHMWNIVRMDDGRNYLVDVTNCDEGAAGYPDALFLKPCVSGSADSSYRFAPNGDTSLYQYDSSTRKAFPIDDLTLSTTAYAAPERPAVAIDAAHFPDDAFRAYVLVNFDADGNSVLTGSEADAAAVIDVPGRGIASMAGLEYFPKLLALDCRDNRLTALDLSGFRKLDAAQVQAGGQRADTPVPVRAVDGRYAADLSGVDLPGAVENFPGAAFDASAAVLTYDELPGGILCTCDTGLPGAPMDVTFPADYQAPAYYETTVGEAVRVEAGMHAGRKSGEGYAMTDMGGDPSAWQSGAGYADTWYGTDGVAWFNPTAPGLHMLQFTDMEDTAASGTCLVLVHAGDALALPAGLTTIEAEAFAGFGGAEVAIPEGVESIGSRAFADCPNLRVVTLPAGSVSIAADAFEGCGSLALMCAEGSAAERHAVGYKIPHIVK